VSLPAELRDWPQQSPFHEIEDHWAEVIAAYGPTKLREAKAALGRADRFFLLGVLLNRPDVKHPWLYAQCREVERAPGGFIDRWAREHYKSTIITFAGVIQEVLKDPEITVGIFSHTRPVANKFLNQIKREFEHNVDLQQTYPDVLWQKAHRDAPLWSLDKGITVKRNGNAKEATIEACGLVDGMPTGAHYLLRVYDDVVTQKSVSTPEQVNKTTEAYELSDNLGARGHDGLMREWMIGTRYTYADTYQHVLDRKTLRPRIRA